MRALQNIGIWVCCGLLWGCAQPGRPSGGPMDRTPPEVVLAVPPNGSTQWVGTRVELVFDEYIKLNQPQQQIFISPPTSEALDYELRGKRLSIILPNDLLPNTTYVIQFGEALTDLNEGNTLEGFSYVFSTGLSIDSLVLRGTVRDAQQNEAPEGMKIHLYPLDSSYSDSVPVLQLPRYVGVVSEDGTFEVTNIREGKYRVLGLADGNSNYKYDLPTEQIATHPPVELSTRDSLQLELYAFKPLPQLQLRSSRLSSPRTLQLAFNRPIDTLILQDLPDYHSILWNATADSARIFLSDTLRDTIHPILEIHAGPEFRADTAKVPPRNAKERAFALTSVNIDRRKLPRDGVIEWTASAPIADAALAILMTELDTHDIPLEFEQNILRAVLPWSYEFKGELWLTAESLTDIYGRTLDSASFALETKKEIDYATLILDFEGEDSAKFYVIELRNSTGFLVGSETVQGGKELIWADLQPQQLQIRALNDANGNGKWDPGDYWRGTATEVYHYFDSSVDLKPNWEMEYRWSLKKE